ncbi:MAG: hypothetical protein ACYDA6_10870, partial [Solirubrobacteraceae bacterium]
MSAHRRALLLAGLASVVLPVLGVLFVALLTVSVVGGLAAGASGCDSRAALALPSSGGVLVAATVYTGSGPGAYGAGLAGHLAFAELGLWSESDTNRAHADRIGTALGLGGALAPFSRLRVSAPNGRSVIAEKRDVGMGGAPIDGHPRAIDLWTATREALGLPPDWSGLVRIEALRSSTLSTEAAAGAGAPLRAGHLDTPRTREVGRRQPQGPEREGGEGGEDGEGREGGGIEPAGREAATGQPAGGAACSAGSLPAEASGSRIVAIARGQLGVSEHPAGSECTGYGPCEPWC